jgi:hypothetical protein
MTAPKWFRDFFTERDGVSWCLGRAIGLVAFGEISYQFITTGSKDWQGFCIGVAALIAAVAAKNFSEKEKS